MNNVPLPEKLRPQKLSEFTGQEHLVGKNGIIRKLLLAQRSSKKRVGHAPRSPERSRRGEVGFPSIFFWGPPGSGKTTIIKAARDAGHLAYDLEDYGSDQADTPGRIAQAKKIIEDYQDDAKVLIGMADVDPKVFPNDSIKIMLLPSLKVYRARLQDRDAEQADKRDQGGLEYKYDEFKEWA
ncbi:hypothetical protein KKB40_01585, partial [Patescibacteria group bacterium]|nr:hypothetical protein [Patescibacteria group bacterium]